MKGLIDPVRGVMLVSLLRWVQVANSPYNYQPCTHCSLVIHKNFVPSEQKLKDKTFLHRLRSNIYPLLPSPPQPGLTCYSLQRLQGQPFHSVPLGPPPLSCDATDRPLRTPKYVQSTRPGCHCLPPHHN